MSDMKQGLTSRDMFLKHADAVDGVGPDWLKALRRRGREHFAKLGFPTTREEAWRQTSLAALQKATLAHAEAKPTTAVEADAYAALRYAGFSGTELIFHNGRFTERRDGAESLPTGVKVLPLSEAIAREPELVAQHLGEYIDTENHALAALNTAFTEDGVVIVIPRNAIVEQPIHLLFISDASAGGAFHAHPRLLIVAEAGSKATIIETWAAAGDDAIYFNNPVTELTLGANAELEHVKITRESDAAFHVGTVQYQQGRDSRLLSHTLTFGGGLVRHDIGSYLGGENAHADMNGIYILKGRQHVDNHTRLDHASPHCTSHELFKGVLDDQSTAVFTGRINVHPGAQKTDAIQANRALLLSDAATINSQPQLEIFADDVKCTHGATVGQLDEDAQFYLRARGIGRDEARGILTFAFANEIIERVSSEAVREKLEALLADGLGIHAQAVK